MAKTTVEGGKGGRSLKPSFSSKLKKLAVATPGIIGASVLEGIGGPKAKGAKIVAKTSARVARAIAKEAAGPKAKGIIARKVPLYDLKTAKMTTKTGSSTTIQKGTSAKRAPMTKAEIAEKNKVVTKKMTAAEKTAAKDAAKARKQAPAKNREAAKPTTAGVKKFTPRPNKLVRRARTVDQLGKSSASKIEKKITAKQEKKLEARKNRANRPALIAKNKAAVKRVGEQKQADKARQSAETKLLNDKTPVKQYDDKGRVIGSTTRGELRQLKIKVDRAAKDTRNSLRGKPQRTIDERTPRPKELTDKEVQILRTVGKRDYSKGEVNPLAQRTVQQEADDIVRKVLNDPRVKAQDAARTKAAIEKTKSDKATSRSIQQAPKKTFRGKAK